MNRTTAVEFAFGHVSYTIGTLETAETTRFDQARLLSRMKLMTLRT